MAVRVKANRFVVDEHGKPQAVILSLTDIRKLVRLVEDRQDVGDLKRAIRTRRGTISHAKLLGHLKRQGLI